MKILVVIMLFLFPSLSSARDNYFLAFENDELLIILNLKCSPCDLACNKIDYQLFDKQRQSALTGTATPVVSLNSHNFRGYMLHNKTSNFSLLEADEENSWTLNINSHMPKNNKNTFSKDQYKVTNVFSNGIC